MPVPSNPQDLINLIREKLFNNTSGLIEEPDLREVLENIVKVLDAKFSMFSPNLTEEQFAKWNLILDYMANETKGVLSPTSPAPTEKGKYLLSSAGTYTNLGGLVATADKLNYAYFNGTTWSKVEVEVELINNLDFEIDLSDVEISKISNGINIKINSDILFFQKFSSKYFRLKAGSYDFENGNYIRLMAGANEVSSTTPSGSDLTLGGVDYSGGGSTKSVLGIAWNNKLISKYYQKEEAKDFYFYYKDGKTLALQENGIKLYVTESVLFFEKNSNRFFK